jgi:hypothetical protein
MVLPSCPWWYYDVSLSCLGWPGAALSTHLSTTLGAHLCKWLTLMSHSCLTTIIWILLVHTSWSLPPLRPCHVSDFRLGWACDCFYRRTFLIQDCQSLNHYLLHHSQCPSMLIIDIWYHTNKYSVPRRRMCSFYVEFFLCLPWTLHNISDGCVQQVV